MTIHLVNDDAELKSAFRTAQDGDRIELASGGTFAGVSLRDRQFQTALTITSEDPENPAVFSQRLHMQGVANVTVTDIAITRVALPDSGSAGALTLKGTHGVTLEDIRITGHVPTAEEGLDPMDPEATRGSVIAGYGYGMGMRILNSSGTVVSGLEIEDVKTALRVEKSDTVLLSGLDIHDVREGVNFFSMSDFTITGSHFHDFKPWWNGSPKHNDHPDMIQFWGSPGGVEDIVITGNVFEQPEGWTQSIFGQTGGTPDDAPTRGIEISDNVIVNGHQNAIYLSRVSDVVIDNNLVLPNSPTFQKATNVPKILLYGVENARITGNVAPGWFDGEVFNTEPAKWAALGMTVEGNVGLTSDVTDGGHWGALLDAWQQDDPTLVPGQDDIAGRAMSILGADAFVPAPEEHMEAGTVTVAEDHGGAWQSVSFASTIRDARVVMGPLSSHDPDGALVRVRNVTDQGFEFRIDEWDYLDGAHGGETVSWVAGTQGSYLLGSGTMVTFGRVRAQDETAVNVALEDAAGRAIFAQVATTNGQQAVVARVSDVGDNGFSLRMQEEEAGDGTHRQEKIDWMAIDYGGTGAGMAGMVNETGTVLPVDTDAFVFLAATQTMNGPDTNVLRYDRDAGTTTVMLQEEQSADSELSHVDEALAVLSMESGAYAFIA